MGEKRTGKGICLDAKYLRGKSSATIIEKGKFVYSGDNIILVDGENSGEVFTVPQDGYMGSTFKQLWLSSVMWRPYILAFILFYKEELREIQKEVQLFRTSIKSCSTIYPLVFHLLLSSNVLQNEYMNYRSCSNSFSI